MFVCLCEGVNDRTVRAAIRNGADTIEEVTAACGAGGGCGGCHSTIDRLIEAVQDDVVPLSCASPVLGESGGAFERPQGRPRAA